AERGEPRGQRGRGTDLQAAGLGSCTDCGLCVQACPVGIDIRDGLQYECIACTACIDACDVMMDKMKYPRGLIRYATETGLERKLNSKQMFERIYRPRVLIYGCVLIVIATAFTFSLARRPLVRIDVVRDRATLARIVERGHVENVYRLQLMNATEHAQRYHIGIEGLAGAQLNGVAGVDVDAAQARWVTLAVRLPPQAAEQAGPGVHPLRFVIDAGDGTPPLAEKSTFVIPR
ncbi:MAG TPA: FixG Ig-like domain-containing protein, partial [Burkholderiaceae bacterium]